MKHVFIIKNKTLQQTIITAFPVFLLLLSFCSSVLTDIPRCSADGDVQTSAKEEYGQSSSFDAEPGELFTLPDEYLKNHPDVKKTDALLLYDFETEDSVNTWTEILYSDSVSIKHSAIGGHHGGGALLCSERQSCYDGPALDITPYVEPETNYTLRFCIKYTNGSEPENGHTVSGDSYLRLSVKKQYEGSDKVIYTNLVTIPSPAEGTWYERSCNLSLPADVNNAKIYFESSSRTSTLWIDDVVLSPAAHPEGASAADSAPESTGTSVYDFEGTVPGIFRSVNKASVSVTDNIAVSGISSLRISKRENSYSGVAVDVSALTPGKPYRCSTSITHLDNKMNSKNYSMYLRYHLSEYTFKDIPLIVDQPTYRGTWSVMTSIFTIPENALNPVIYIASSEQAADENDKPATFYLDDFTLTDNTETIADIERARKKLIITITVIAAVTLVFVYITISLALRRKLKEKIEEASKDSMTGTYNRNTYETFIETLIKKPEKAKELFIAVCDVNGLKMLNDNYGHHIGDSCITKCAGLLLEVMKPVRGRVYRTGGDEFVCISPKPFKEQLNQKLSDEEQNFTEYPFAVAVGFSQYNSYEDGDKPDIKEMIARGDKEMYLNKKRKQKNTKTY